ncbi:MAG: dihydroorotase family protein, partial [Betaproteobacteria bacterium]|nr:dihydroorotase family protein [Betaproteobacteria bacterium]
MARIAIKGATLLGAGSRPARADIFIDKGKIVAIGRQPRSFTGARKIDAAGLHAAPPLLDRMAVAAPPSALTLAAAVAGGSGNVLLRCAPATAPAAVRCHMLAPLLDEDGVVGDLPASARAGCCGFWLSSHQLDKPESLLRAMRIAASCDLPVVADPRIRQLGAEARLAAGVKALRLGLAGMPQAAEAAAVALLIECAAEAGCRLHLAGISCQRSLRFLAAAKSAGEAVTADVQAANVLLDEDDAADFSLRHLVYPPLRSAQNRKALAAALAAGVIDAMVTGHDDVPAERESELF